MLPFCPNQLSQCRNPCFSSPTFQVQVWSCSFPSSFSLPSFIQLNFVWIHIFLWSGQRLLPALRLCSVVPSASENVFLMDPWRETYSTSTSTVLSLVSGCVFTFSFSLILLCIIKKSFISGMLISPFIFWGFDEFILAYKVSWLF